MNTRRLLLAIFTLTGFATMAAPALHAQAAITWSPAYNITNDSDVRTNGTILYAYNLGDSVDQHVDPVVVNGVTFNPAGAANADFSFNVTGAGAVEFYYDFMGSQVFGLSIEYHTLLTFGSYADTTTETGVFDRSLTLKNLTVGYTYQVQLWANDARSDFNSNIPGRTTVASDSFDNTVTYAFNQNDPVGSLGQYVIGTFTATDTTEEIFLQIGPGGNGISVQLNALAVSVTAVPEPSTYAAFAGLGALGVVIVRRRATRHAARLV